MMVSIWVGLIRITWLALSIIVLFSFKNFLIKRRERQYADGEQEQEFVAFPTVAKVIFWLVLPIVSILPFADPLMKTVIRQSLFEHAGVQQIKEEDRSSSIWIGLDTINNPMEVDGLLNETVLKFRATRKTEDPFENPLNLLKLKTISGIALRKFDGVANVDEKGFIRVSLSNDATRCTHDTSDLSPDGTLFIRRHLVETKQCLIVEPTSETPTHLYSAHEWIPASEGKYLPFRLDHRRWTVQDISSGEIVASFRQFGTYDGLLRRHVGDWENGRLPPWEHPTGSPMMSDIKYGEEYGEFKILSLRILDHLLKKPTSN